MTRETIQVAFDGACEPVNPGGYGSYGVVVKQDGQTLLREAKRVGQGPSMSNNVAEYAGVVRALELLCERGLNGQPVRVTGDSQLVIQQMSGRWRIKKGLYKPMALKAQSLLAEFPNISFQWVPRDENAECDALATEALAGVVDPVDFQTAKRR